MPAKKPSPSTQKKPTPRQVQTRTRNEAAWEADMMRQVHHVIRQSARSQGSSGGRAGGGAGAR
jgi:hypothetical protein